MRAQGRTASYEPPEGSNDAPLADVSVRWTAAEDVFVPVAGGEERKRSLILTLQIGAETGMLSRVQVNGVFLLDVDGTGEPVEWAVYALLHTDAEGEAGFVRVQCVRDVIQSGIVGTTRPKVRGRS